MAEISIWVGNLPQGTTTDQLRAEFVAKGVKTMSDVFKFPEKNFGFVRFTSDEEAQAALVQAAGITINGEAVEMKIANSKKKSGGDGWGAWGGGWGGGGWGPMMGWGAWDPWSMWGGKGGWGPYGGGKGGKGGGNTKWNGEYSIWVGGLPEGTTSEELKEAVTTVGVTTMADVYAPPGKNFGFIRFGTQEEAEAASQLTANGLTIRGQTVEARLSNTEKQKRAGGGWGKGW
ncbi:unnamed protein product [Prorocentrum cordatum]|uniref:RRM domain-containing protein n=1 Tax=Prorocentrum cordatum TaxID=2364126 RepID=A0ABN9UT49_9DINO|nr:unnamed protein product [Polarella glacialis]